ncbi:Hom end-associated [Carpediemonas membranifera]|uniref:Hom end-associated n=1 Tax=Carpediemonas membranifera TaxID=201153 RepID=A0A8J6E4M0_9EUKA|nr:Hom end-associated [Carpediemonas membranifera]|eukprot:KAG9397121.1 Hom end-associated [Carpediemonas membranifera]
MGVWQDLGLSKDIEESVTLMDWKEPYEVQRRVIPVIARGENAVGSAKTGSGKCLARDTPVLMANGEFKPVQDIVAGERLMGDDGTPRLVTSVTTGRQEMARVTLEGGAVFRCNMSHILTVALPEPQRLAEVEGKGWAAAAYRLSLGLDGSATAIQLESQKFDTKAVAEGWLASVVGNPLNVPADGVFDISVESYFALPDAIRAELKAVIAPELSFHGRADPAVPVHPYVVGAWLGAAWDDAMPEDTPAAVLEAIEELLPNRDPVEAMRPYGKRVPPAIKYGPAEARRQCLAGLVDTNGYQSGSRGLVDDAAFMARSLGLVVTKSGEITGDLTRLPLRVESSRPQPDHHRQAFTVERLPVGDYYGFTIDGNRRFVINHEMVVTHNTGAFVLPMLDKFIANPDRPSFYSLVLVSTKELAAQIAGVITSVSRIVGERVNVLTLTSGKHQGKPCFIDLSDRPHFIVATPGKLLAEFTGPNGALIKTYFNNLQYLVLDEADQLLNKSFLEQIREIISQIPRSENRVTALFSATIDEKVAHLRNMVLGEEKWTLVEVDKGTVDTLRQSRIMIRRKHEGLQNVILIHLMMLNAGHKHIVFVPTKEEAIRVALLVNAFWGEGASMKAVPLCSLLDRDTRMEYLNRFANGTANVLVATDVASRGLDIPFVEVVIQCDVPLNPELYVHKVGRTARAGRTGNAFLLVKESQLEDFAVLEQSSTKLNLRENLKPMKISIDSIPAEIQNRVKIAAKVAKEADEEQQTTVVSKAVVHYTMRGVKRGKRVHKKKK